jgi:hypothetical protein
VYSKFPKLYPDKHYFESVGLTHRQIKEFYLIFSQVDHSGDIAASEELFNFFDVNHSVYSRRARAVTNFSKEMSFVEFVLTVSPIWHALHCIELLVCLDDAMR